MKQLLFFLFLSLQLSAQDFLVKKGVVIDDLKVGDSLEESYSLYLPLAYENGKQWPMLLIFDGEGRGKSAAHLFRLAAEEQGYLLVSSNDISDQNDLEENVMIASRLLQYVTAILPVDFQQVSTSGSMTGAKVASSFPLIFDNIHGVVAVGDHWLNFNLLDERKNFAFIGIVGDEQFSVAEMNHTADLLARLKFPSQVYTYDGNEEWPSPEIINSAVASLSLDAMRKGKRPVDRQLIENLYQQDLARVNKLMSLNQLLNAENLLDIMEEKYDDLIDNSQLRSQQDQLSRSRNYSLQKREQNEISQKESRLMDDFIYYMEDDIRSSNFENLGWWNYQKIQLDSLSQRNNAEDKMAVRLKGFIKEYARLKRSALKEDRTSSLESKLLANMLHTIFDPQAFDAYKEIISLSAQDNDFQTAYFYLEEMLKHGFKDMQALYKIEGTLGLRLTPEYNSIIEKYLGTSKFH
ncbi:hypothetical protein [Salinimicrobium oceani]|uniref:Alpha/beta hydrolase n=1 Tax=Salinimicrobium oceani TaxID=2722702 RepID=A0ABX1D216_9FLAO|nr:hypothetical protein [Salinimicrobium oceani]NJW53714.1 hypothetical protein [Salinimicrobium oceani]